MGRQSGERIICAQRENPSITHTHKAELPDASDEIPLETAHDGAGEDAETKAISRGDRDKGRTKAGVQVPAIRHPWPAGRAVVSSEPSEGLSGEQGTLSPPSVPTFQSSSYC